MIKENICNLAVYEKNGEYLICYTDDLNDNSYVIYKRNEKDVFTKIVEDESQWSISKTEFYKELENTYTKIIQLKNGDCIRLPRFRCDINIKER